MYEYITLDNIAYSDTDDEISTSGPVRTRSCSDIVFRTLFEEKCSFPLPEHEVPRIQHAVELMVLYLLTMIYEQTSFSDLVCSNKKVIKTLRSIKSLHPIHEKFNQRNLLKVGSYYENTKNCFPDEFDYICVIAKCEEPDYIRMKDVTSTITDIFHKCLRNAILNGLKFPVGNCLEFDGFIRVHGPAAMLKFRYKSLNDSAHLVFVDISPACKVDIINGLPKEISCPYSEWKDIILETGSFLILKVFNGGHPKNETKIKIAITESEQRYIREKMSEQHKRVYRLLKYFFKGDLTDEELRQHIRNEANAPDLVCCRLFHPRIVYDLTSYIIKSLIFHHCHNCECDAETTYTDCVVAIFTHLLALFKQEQKRYPRCFKPFLECRGREISFSVSLKTMTGEDTEIADRYRSSVKIVKVLKKFVRTITDTCDTSERSCSCHRQIADKIPIAKELQKIVQRDIDKHVRGKLRTDVLIQSLCIVLTFAILTACVYLGALVYDASQIPETQYCFTGSDYLGSIVSFNDGNATFKSSLAPEENVFENRRNILRHMLCMEQKQSSDEKVPENSMLYYCGNENCTVERIYRLKTANDESDQRIFCGAYTIPGDRDEPRDNVLPVQYNGRRVTCVLENKACFSMKVKHFIGGRLENETSTCYEDDSHCLKDFLKEKNIQDCNVSKRRYQGDASISTHICCCDMNPCTSPELPSDLVRSIAKLTIGVLVTISLLCALAGRCIRIHKEYNRLTNIYRRATPF